MNRHLLGLAIMAILSAAVGAQGTRPITPAQKAELFRRNRPVIERLVEKSVEASHHQNDHLKRADTYYKVLFDFSREIRAARDANDMQRVDELTAHLKFLLDEGLAVTLRDARKQVEEGTNAEDYVRIRDGLLAQIGVLLEVMDDQSPAKKSLEDARGNLRTIVGRKK